MFILRRVSSKGIEMNFNLGDQYTLIQKDRNHEEFYRTAYSQFGHGIDDEWLGLNNGDRKKASEAIDKDNGDRGVFAFVSNEGGSKIFPLFEGQQNYIMTGEGKTFSRIR